MAKKATLGKQPDFKSAAARKLAQLNTPAASQKIQKLGK